MPNATSIHFRKVLHVSKQESRGGGRCLMLETTVAFRYTSNWLQSGWQSADSATSDVGRAASHPGTAKVFIPDILEDNLANIEWRVAPDTFVLPIRSYFVLFCRAKFDQVPPVDDEKKNQLYPYLEGHANPDRNSMKVPGILHVLKNYNPGIQSWGIVGFCWGGKMVSINARDPTLFTAAAQCHPALLDSCDAASIRIPTCILASGDEDPEDVAKYASCLKGEKLVETFGGMQYGWMSARGDLEDETKRYGYGRGYQTLVEFFLQHLYGKGERRLEELILNEPLTIGCED